jgi:hypothetical protein
MCEREREHAALQIVIFIAFNKRKSKDSMKLPKFAKLQFFPPFFASAHITRDKFIDQIIYVSAY